jgi:hypothetical protein
MPVESLKIQSDGFLGVAISAFAIVVSCGHLWNISHELPSTDLTPHSIV